MNWFVKARSRPIVIGRDHLDSGSVASPYRETEAMLDGSDAIADWPLLNALTATSSGATWVSIHHGGGVGIGRSIHAGQVSLADGSELAEEKLRAVLTNDPAMGVFRHVDAGYDRAHEVAEARCARSYGVQVSRRKIVLSTVFTGISQLHTVSKVGTIEDAAFVVDDGQIAWVGWPRKLPRPMNGLISVVARCCPAG